MRKTTIGLFLILGRRRLLGQESTAPPPRTWTWSGAISSRTRPAGAPPPHDQRGRHGEVDGRRAIIRCTSERARPIHTAAMCPASPNARLFGFRSSTAQNNGFTFDGRSQSNRQPFLYFCQVHGRMAHEGQRSS